MCVHDAHRAPAATTFAPVAAPEPSSTHSALVCIAAMVTIDPVMQVERADGAAVNARHLLDASQLLLQVRFVSDKKCAAN